MQIKYETFHTVLPPVFPLSPESLPHFIHSTSHPSLSLSLSPLFSPHSLTHLFPSPSQASPSIISSYSSLTPSSSPSPFFPFSCSCFTYLLPTLFHPNTPSVPFLPSLTKNPLSVSFLPSLTGLSSLSYLSPLT